MKALCPADFLHKHICEICRYTTPSTGPFWGMQGPAFGIKVANTVISLTYVARLSTFAGLKVLGLTYVPYVLRFQNIVVKWIIFQVRGKKYDWAIIFNHTY